MKLLKFHKLRKYLMTAGISWLLLSAALGMGNSPQSFVCEPDDTALAKAVRTIGEVRAFSKQLGIDTPPIATLPSRSVFYPELGRHRNIKSFQIGSAEDNGVASVNYWWIEVDATGDFVSQILFRPKPNRQAVPFVAALKQEEAISLCQKYVELLTSGQGMRLKFEYIEFAQERNFRYKSTPYTGAYWRATFQRVSRTGLPVLRDSVSVSIHEKLGLHLYTNDCVSKLDVPGDEKPTIDENDAVARAVPAINQMMKEGPAVKAFFGSYVLSGAPLAKKLVITRPNDLLTCKDLHFLKWADKARLVWVVTFEVTDPQKKQQPRFLQVYIDALTGEFVGGEC